MKPLEVLHRNKQPLPPMAGGAPEPGEQLSSYAQYMDSEKAATIAQWVDAWRRMPREEFEKSAQRL
jgi:hypothetical protein